MVRIEAERCPYCARGIVSDVHFGPVNDERLRYHAARSVADVWQGMPFGDVLKHLKRGQALTSLSHGDALAVVAALRQKGVDARDQPRCSDFTGSADRVASHSARPEPEAARHPRSRPTLAPPTGPSKALVWLIVAIAVLPVVLVVVGTIGIYGFKQFMKAAKKTEATTALQRLTRGMVHCARKPHPMSGRPRGLPPTSKAVPLSMDDLAGRRYPSTSADWQDTAFVCAGFRFSDPQYFQYQWQQTSPFTGKAVARADLDGDGAVEIDVEQEVTCVAPGSCRVGLPTEVPAAQHASETEDSGPARGSEVSGGLEPSPDDGVVVLNDAPRSDQSLPQPRAESPEHVDAIRAKAMTRYRRELMLWFNHRWRTGALQDLPCVTVRPLAATANLTIEDGVITSAQVVTRSGNPRFDQAAGNAVQSWVSARLPPTPPGYPDILAERLTATLTGANVPCR